MTSISLEQQARLESGLGLVFEATETITASNGDPNLATEPLTEGFDVSDHIWSVYAIRPTGGTLTYRLWVVWKGQTVWDCIENSEKTAQRNTTQRPRISGATRFYVEIVLGTATTVDVLVGNATGITQD